MTLLSTVIKDINFLSRLLVSKAMLNNLQTWLQTWAGIAAQQTGDQGIITSGLETTVTPDGTHTIFTVQAGYGTDARGKPLLVPDILNFTNTDTYATQKKCLLVLKFLGTQTTSTTTPAETGYLYTEYASTIELLVGTSSAYPAVTNYALVLVGVTLDTNGTLLATDYSVASYPRVGLKGNAYWTNRSINPTLIPANMQLAHYEMTLDATTLTVAGSLITGNLSSSGSIVYATGGKIVELY